MSTKLRNRRVAEEQLGSFLEQSLVSEELIHAVMDAPVSGGQLGHSARCDKVVVVCGLDEGRV
jgi:hypothetical protein